MNSREKKKKKETFCWMGLSLKSFIQFLSHFEARDLQASKLKLSLEHTHKLSDRPHMKKDKWFLDTAS